MASLPVITLDDGSPGVECPRCGAVVQPEKNVLFDGYDCPECSGSIDTAALRQFQRAMRRWEDGESDE